MVQLTNLDLSFIKPNVPTVQTEIKTGILAIVPISQTLECPATQTAEMELDKFRLFKFDPCSWWSSNREQFPRIAAIKNKLDAVSATTLDAEHAFSISSYIFSKYGNRMSPEKLELKMKMKCNVAPVVEKKIHKLKEARSIKISK